MTAPAILGRRPGVGVRIGAAAAVAAAAAALAAGCSVERLVNRVSGGPLPAVSPHAAELHASSFIVDLHADSLLWRRDLARRSTVGAVDLPRLRAGNVGLQVFTIVTSFPIASSIERSDPRWGDAITLLALTDGWPIATYRSLTERALYQARKLERLAAADPRLALVRTRADLRALEARRRVDPAVVGALLGIEGAHALDGELANLDRLFDAGVRVVGLAHFFDNDFAGSAHGLAKGGLTALGRQLVAEVERRAMILDLAHASEATIRDALAIVTRPPLLSHTGVKATCPNARNLSDDQVRAIAAAGGVIGIGYWKTAVCGTAPEDVVRAMRHVADLVGDEHVALGSDFDGAVTTPFDAAGLSVLTQALLDGGFDDAAVRRILGGNALRLLAATLPE